jgi:hypothetical protein
VGAVVGAPVVGPDAGPVEDNDGEADELEKGELLNPDVSDGPVGKVVEKGAVPDGVNGPVGKTPVPDGVPDSGRDEPKVELGKLLKLGVSDDIGVTGIDEKGAVPDVKGAVGDVAGSDELYPELADGVPVSGMAVVLSLGPVVTPLVGAEDPVAAELPGELNDTGAVVLLLPGAEVGTPPVGDVSGGP